ncbi:C-Myc-binding protein isoform X2 [Monodelphis domestica]|uniref:C-Myc-binding protein isoform X2 n=1 Tax=Monodelphis domestica TaxID=13616 RepID=UPI0024E276C3|nr:C-Myc-binding protein isoform X2 [Monodelphis domestica]
MAHYKAADSKREQFRRYLEKSGVLDTLTKELQVEFQFKESSLSSCLMDRHLVSGIRSEDLNTRVSTDSQKARFINFFFKHFSFFREITASHLGKKMKFLY